MALIKCPRCESNVSDTAEVCIHCRYPLTRSDYMPHSNNSSNVHAPTIDDITEEDLVIAQYYSLSQIQDDGKDFPAQTNKGSTNDKVPDTIPSVIVSTHAQTEPQTQEDRDAANARALVNKADNLRNAKNYLDAITLYQKAAELGNVQAQVWLGNFYRRGLGVTIDYSKAIYWFEFAVKQGNTDAMNNLGVLYLEGKGVLQDFSKAENLFTQASQKGNTLAKRNLEELKLRRASVEAKKKSDKKLACYLGVVAVILVLGIWWLVEDLGESASGVILAYILAVVVAALIVYFYFISDDKPTLREIKQNGEREKYNNFQYTCPHCKSKKVKRIGEFERGLSVHLWGLASSKIGKQYICDNCKHKW